MREDDRVGLFGGEASFDERAGKIGGGDALAADQEASGVQAGVGDAGIAGNVRAGGMSAAAERAREGRRARGVYITDYGDFEEGPRDYPCVRIAPRDAFRRRHT